MPGGREKVDQLLPVLNEWVRLEFSSNCVRSLGRKILPAWRPHGFGRRSSGRSSREVKVLFPSDWLGETATW